MSRPVSSKHVVTTSFLVDISDFILNIIVAMVSGSIILRAEALQGGADLVTSGLLFLGLRRATKRANRRHPFGFGRELYFWTFIASIIMLTITGTLTIYGAWLRFIHPQPLANVGLALTALIIGLITNSYAFSLSIRRLKEQDSHQALWHSFFLSDLVETKTTFVLDAMGSFSALFGIINLVAYMMTGDPRFDAIGAFLIGLTIALFAGFLVIEVKDLLIGRSALPEVEDNIKQAALEIKGVKSVLDLRTMSIGSAKLLVNMEVKMKQGLKTNALEQLMDKIKDNVKEHVPSVKHIQVELETSIEE